jgi:hypothetical protein
MKYLLILSLLTTLNFANEENAINEKIVFSTSFIDKEGSKKIIVTEKEKNNRSSILVNILLNNKHQTKVYDLTEACIIDHFARFNANSFTLTDLNHNGITEITFSYSKTCAGDMSAADKKLILIEGSDKYKLRGSTAVIFGDKKNIDTYKIGQFKLGDKMKKADNRFRNHAIKVWNQTIESEGFANQSKELILYIKSVNRKFMAKY